MSWTGWAQIALVLASILATAPLLARWIVAVAAGRVRRLAGAERLVFAAAGIDPARGMGRRPFEPEPGASTAKPL